MGASIPVQKTLLLIAQADVRDVDPSIWFCVLAISLVHLQLHAAYAALSLIMADTTPASSEFELEDRGEQRPQQLPPVDGGKDAWLFLAASFVIEALVWGEYAIWRFHACCSYMRQHA